MVGVLLPEVVTKHVLKSFLQVVRPQKIKQAWNVT